MPANAVVADNPGIPRYDLSSEAGTPGDCAAGLQLNGNGSV
jgi:hypothetical protein